MNGYDTGSVIKARFLSNAEIKEICSMSIVSENEKQRFYFELPPDDNDRKCFYCVPLFPDSPVRTNDTVLPEKIILITIDKFTDCYAWRFGDTFPIEFTSNDPYTSRILSGSLNREEYYREIEEERKRKEEKKQKKEEVRKQDEDNKELLQKETWIGKTIPYIGASLACLLFLFVFFYFGVLKGDNTCLMLFGLLIIALFLVPLLLLCKRIWEELSIYSVSICIALSITMSIFTMRGINNLVNGDVHIDPVHSSPGRPSSNHATVGFDPFPDEDVDVYVTMYGNCYHSTRNCYEITKSKHISKISKKKARTRHYAPCSVCYGTY